MISLARTCGRLDAQLRAGRWESQWAVATPPPPPWPELTGKTLGILGFGHIGEALARRARAFDMTLCAVRRQAQPAVPAGGGFIGGAARAPGGAGPPGYLPLHLSPSPSPRRSPHQR